MDVTLFLPELHHPAIEERYASWQTELLLRRDRPALTVRRYPMGGSPDLSTTGDLVAVVTTPLIVPSPGLLTNLLSALDANRDCAAAVPRANVDGIRAATLPNLYISLRQFEEVSRAIPPRPVTVDWSDTDPIVFVARKSALPTNRDAASLLRGLRVAIAPEGYVHLYASQRGQARIDLLERVDASATRVLEFGCGEAATGAALKQRQPCRVVGVEMDTTAAAIAAQRIDQVVTGDVRKVVSELDEKFDFIIGGDIVEHLDDPWTFLRELRRVAAPHAKLLLSLPNIANWAIVSDLLRGRFDYVYLGILCAGHLRFFTRRSIGEMLTIAGWQVQSIEPQEPFVTEEYRDVLTKLQTAGIEHSVADLETPGWYVTGVNVES